MINENAQKDAFGLFEKGRYAECLNIIHAIGHFSGRTSSHFEAVVPF